ncbi:hypothetical protein TNCV_1913501 [Trichonephila clavipes]|nr:hypothetical protein TNCV_1913501 [Trichonephila clavipes]
MERVFPIGNDFGTSEKSRLNVDTLDTALTVKFNITDISCSEIFVTLENDILTKKKIIQKKNTRLSENGSGGRGVGINEELEAAMILTIRYEPYRDFTKTTLSETVLRSRENEKISQFCVTVKKQTEVIFPHPRNRRHVRMPKSNAQRGKEFRERKKKGKLAASPVEKVTKKPQKNSANSSSATAKSRSEYMREYEARKKHCKIIS